MAEAPSERIANCPNPDCRSPILSNHSNPWCLECGERLPEDVQLRLPRVQETRTKAAAAMADLVKQSGDIAQPFEVLGRPMTCVVCWHDRFFRKELDLRAAAASLFDDNNLTSAKGTCLVCSRCGYVHWFSW